MLVETVTERISQCTGVRGQITYGVAFDVRYRLKLVCMCGSRICGLHAFNQRCGVNLVLTGIDE